MYGLELRRHSNGIKLVILIIFLILVFLGHSLTAQHSDAASFTAVDISDAQGKPDYGIVFINSAEEIVDEQRWTNAQASGAAWDRYPIYWFYIETSEGVFDWSKQDAAVQGNIDHGIDLDAILLGTPAFYQNGSLLDAPLPYRHPDRQGKLFLDAVERSTPLGLYEPVFTDGDVPGPNKIINPENKWAVFVELTVNRYKPGGVLAKSNSWSAGEGVTVWEMWNEADVPFFWDASVGDYARLLKVGYLAAKHADPQSEVMFGGLAMWQFPDYYDQVLDVFSADPLAAGNDYFHDIMAIHNYSRPERAREYVLRIKTAMQAQGQDKPIWMNESGVPTWNDYPGPVWEPLSPLRATQEEMAAFTIQNAFYGLSAGLDGLFHFQLYDGCGNQPEGTDFPPHDGSLCDENNNYNGKPCAGDAYGLYRNPPHAACFTQHPQPETARPVLSAYQVLTTYVAGVEPYWQERHGRPIYSSTCPWTDGTQEWVALYQPETKKRIVGLWARCGQAETAVIKATDPNGQALLIAQDGTTRALTSVNGYYSISLPAATNRNPNPGSTIHPVYGIGGRPSILVETDLREEDPTPSVTPTKTATATRTAVPTDTPRATATSTPQSDCSNLILNGGFEEESAWVIPFTAYRAAYSQENAHAGERSMRAGIREPSDNVYSYSTTMQTVTIPSGAQDQILRFWLYTSSTEPTSFTIPSDPMALNETNALNEGDAQMVLILDSGGTVIDRLLIDRLDVRDWKPYQFDISHRAGRTIKVYFGVVNNGTGGVTHMYIDDVSLDSCSDVVPTATPTSTRTPPVTWTPTATATATAVPVATATATKTSPIPQYFFYLPSFIYDAPFGISGRIQDSSGYDLSGVAVTTGGNHQAVSDSKGWYSLSNLAPGEYRVRPERAGYSFQPETYRVVIPPSAGRIDFVGQLVGPYP